MLKGPGHRERTAAEENEHDRLAGVDDGFEQLLLPPGQTEIRTRGCLSAHCWRLTECKNHEISPLGGGDRSRELFVAAGENSDAFGAEHVAFSQAPRQLGRKR